VLEQLKVMDRGLIILFFKFSFKKTVLKISQSKNVYYFINIRGFTEWCQKWDANTL